MPRPRRYGDLDIEIARCRTQIRVIRTSSRSAAIASSTLPVVRLAVAMSAQAPPRFGSILSASFAARMQCFNWGDLIDACLRDQKRARPIRVNRKETKCFARRSLQIDPLMLLRNRLDDGTVSGEIVRIQSKGLPGAYRRPPEFAPAPAATRYPPHAAIMPPCGRE